MSQRAGTEIARAVDDRARGIVARVNAAHEMLRGDQMIKLEGLDSAVETLCHDIAGLPHAERQGCKAVLIDLIDEFDRLSEALKAQQSALGEALKDVGNRARATSAYGRAPAGPGGGPKSGDGS